MEGDLQEGIGYITKVGKQSILGLSRPLLSIHSYVSLAVQTGLMLVIRHSNLNIIITNKLHTPGLDFLMKVQI